MRFAIVGVGDYGSRFAAWLMQSGQDVTLIARGKTLERLRTHGLTATKGTVTPACILIPSGPRTIPRALAPLMWCSCV
jgi:2-dehydropantoate 2-reductase